MTDEQEKNETERRFALLCWQVRKILREESKGLVFDFRGHFTRELGIFHLPLHTMTEFLPLHTMTEHLPLHTMTEKELLALQKALNNGFTGRVLTLGEPSILNRCVVCGEPLQMATDGQKIFPTKPCPYPDGIPLVFELNVPSGIMVVANDLRPYFDIPKNNYDLNTAIGWVNYTRAMAAIGCACASVGNTCPRVYRVEQNKFIVVVPGYDDKHQQEIEPKGQQVASITTDVWQYSIVDGDEYVRRGCDGYRGVDRIDVKPGVYTFIHYAHLNDFDRDDRSQPVIFTQFEWTRPPDPAIDYRKE